MTPFYLGEILYLVIAFVFFVVTLFEGWRSERQFDIGRLTGLVSCLFWPVLVLFFIVGLARVGRTTASR